MNVLYVMAYVTLVVCMQPALGSWFKGECEWMNKYTNKPANQINKYCSFCFLHFGLIQAGNFCIIFFNIFSEIDSMPMVD